MRNRSTLYSGNVAKSSVRFVSLVDLAVYIFVRLVTRGRYSPCQSQFSNLSQFYKVFWAVLPGQEETTHVVICSNLLPAQYTY